MLHNLKIKNYRCFEDFNIEGLTRVNLVVGDNNSGKTSLLEAIYLLVKQPESPADKLALLEILQNRGEFYYQIQSDNLINNFKKEEDPKAKTHYIFNRIYYNYQANDIEILSNDNLLMKISSYSDSNYVEVFFKEDLLINNNKQKDCYKTVVYKLSFSGEYQTIPSIKTMKMNIKSSKYPVPSMFISTNKINPDKIAALWDEINLTPKEDKIIEALQIIEPDLERIAFTLNQIPKIAKVKIKNQDTPISLTSMGEGMNRMLTLAMMLVKVENGVLLVDEIETGLHYEAQTDMWRLLIKTAQELNVQVFTTTHSWDCICAFQEALEEFEDKSVGKLFRLDSKYGKLRAVEYLPDELAVAVRQNIEVR